VGFGEWGQGFEVRGVECGVKGATSAPAMRAATGMRRGVWGVGCGVWGVGCGVGFGFWVLGFGFWGLKFGVWVLKFEVSWFGFGVRMSPPPQQCAQQPE